MRRRPAYSLARRAALAALLTLAPVLAQTTFAQTVLAQTVPAQTAPSLETTERAVEIVTPDELETGAPELRIETTNGSGELAELPAPPGPETARLPASAPAVDGPKRVLLAGDNVAFGLAKALQATLADEMADVELLREAVPSSGLVRDDFHDWPAALEARLEEGDVSAVVMLIGVNDRQPLRDDAGSHAPNSDEWLALYRGRVEAVIDVAAQAGVPLVWVGAPIMGSGSLNSTLSLTNPIFRETVTRRGGTFVDSWDQFAIDGAYSRTGPNLAGAAKTRLRTGDGVHFTGAGYEVLASLVAAPLARLPGLARTRQDRQAADAEAILTAPGVTALDMPAGDVPAGGMELESSTLGTPALDMPVDEPRPGAALEGGAPSDQGRVAAEGPPSAPATPAGDAARTGVGIAPSGGAASVAARARPVPSRVGRPVLLTAPPRAEADLVRPAPGAGTGLVSRAEPAAPLAAPAVPPAFTAEPPPAGRIDAP